MLKKKSKSGSNNENTDINSQLFAYFNIYTHKKTIVSNLRVY